MVVYDQILKNRTTPFYIFDQEGFINNYKALQKAMKSIYPKYMLAYSYKTNYTPFICNLVKNMGGYAEVVSDMEYMLAKKLGYTNAMIVYNGPVKGECMYEHVLNGGIINIDTVDEAIEIAKFALYVRKPIKVGIRINLDVGGSFISRFGLCPDSEDIERAINTLTDAEVKINGLHCHISRSRNIDAWERRARIMIEAADKYIKGVPEYISLGSGMFADMAETLKTQFEYVPSYEEYAFAAMKPFKDRYGDNGPIVFTEPGVTVVARYMSFVSSVLSIKEVRGRNIATMDGSFENLGEICTMKKLPIKVIKSNSGKEYGSIDLMRYTCLEQDLMYGEFAGKLAAGDVIAFENVGGYSIVSKPQFIKPNCSMVACDSDGTIKEIMRAETFDDVFSKFTFPI